VCSPLTSAKGPTGFPDSLSPRRGVLRGPDNRHNLDIGRPEDPGARLRPPDPPRSATPTQEVFNTKVVNRHRGHPRQFREAAAARTSSAGPAASPRITWAFTRRVIDGSPAEARVGAPPGSTLRKDLVSNWKRVPPSWAMCLGSPTCHGEEIPQVIGRRALGP